MLIPASNADALLEAMSTMLRNDEMRKRLATNGLATARERTSGAMINAFNDFLEEIDGRQ